MTKKKLSHDYKCQTCGAPATVNIQDGWSRYEITPDGDFINRQEWDGNESDFYCDKCEVS
jgi:hypothetical protein